MTGRRSARPLLVAAVFLTSVTTAFAQTPIQQYLANENAQAVVAKPERTAADLRGIMPHRVATAFAVYVRQKRAGVSLLRQGIEQLRLNKVIGNGSGAAGTTSLVSKVAVPTVVGFATEYGGILQSESGTTSTLRANVLGLANVLTGQDQYCPIVAQAGCRPTARWLQRLSVAASYETVSGTDALGNAAVPGVSAPTAVALLGGGYRLSGFSARIDLTDNDPESAVYQDKWLAAMGSLTSDDSGRALTAAISELLTTEGAMKPVYENWLEESVQKLGTVPPAEFAGALEQQLDVLTVRLSDANPAFMDQIGAVNQARMQYFTARDDLLKTIQSHRWSLEVAQQRSLDQPRTWVARAIYSHQPSKGPLLLTANVAATWYDQSQSALGVGRLKDLQVAAQLDRRLGAVANFGNPVLTFGAYYQRLVDDAIVHIGPENVLPGTGILVPAGAATLLGTKGDIGVVQAKLTLPMSEVLKVPMSVTWSNRTELVNEANQNYLRGQLGFTLDLDSLFKFRK